MWHGCRPFWRSSLPGSRKVLDSQVYELACSILCREQCARLNDFTDRSIEPFDRVGRIDQSSDLGSKLEERYNLSPSTGICQASFPEISQKNRYQLSSSRDVVPDPRIFVYQSRSIDRPRNVLSCSHGTGRDPDDRYHSRSPRIRAGRSFLIHLLLFNRFRWLLRI